MTIDPILDAVLRAIARNRTPGWNFPGHFLDLSFEQVGSGKGHVALHPGGHCVDADGHADLAALCVLADIGMAAAMRSDVGFTSRMATVTLAMSLTGEPATGVIDCRSELDGYVAGIGGKQGLIRSRMYAGEAIVATGTASFLSLSTPNELAPLPAKKREEAPVVEAPDPATLEGAEREIYERAVAALQPGEGDFLQRFWGLTATRTEGGAACDFPNGLHVGNRMGHTQGGLTFALAAYTAIAALDDPWRFVGISAWYVSPGTGPALKARSRVVHAGKLTAVVQTTLTGENGRVVLEATTNHSRSA